MTDEMILSHKTMHPPTTLNAEKDDSEEFGAPQPQSSDTLKRRRYGDGLPSTSHEGDTAETEMCAPSPPLSISSPAAKNKQPPPPGGGGGPKQAYREAYEGLVYEAIPSSGRPGTPHRFFADSYRVRPLSEEDDNRIEGERRGSPADNDIAETTLSGPPSPKILWPVLHRNANGLVVVTAPPPPEFAGGSAAASSLDVRIQLLLAAPGEAAGEQSSLPSKKRRRRRGGDASREVRPSDSAANVASSRVGNAVVPCGVWGTVVETNEDLTPERWIDDPLLSGYLAVVRPIGAFPPPRAAAVDGDSADAPVASSSSSPPTRQ